MSFEFSRVRQILSGSVALLVLFGASSCSSEKAEALLTSIKAFESKSLLALDQIELLYRESDDRSRDPISMDDVFTETVGAIDGGNADTVNFNLMLSYFSSREINQTDDRIAEQIADIRVIYSSIRESYESLPQGSILGAEYVPCGLNVVAKATGQLINFADILNQSPLYPEFVRLQLAEYKSLVRSGDLAAARAKLEVIAQEIAIYDGKHEQAIRLILAAAEDGRNVYELLENYNQVSATDILNIIQFGFDFLGSVQGVNVSQAITRLESIETEFGDDEYWQRVKEIPIVDLTNCPLEIEAKNNFSVAMTESIE